MKVKQRIGGKGVTKRVPGARSRIGAAADEVDDLQPVAFVQRVVSPAVAGHDVAVQFDGDAVGLHAEDFDQSGESEVERANR